MKSSCRSWRPAEIDDFVAQSMKMYKAVAAKASKLLAKGQ
jgi:hypothetical protein